jgi:hypothetical protein
MKPKKAVLMTFGVLAISAAFAATAFACTIFRGTFTVLGNGSSTSVTATGLRTGMIENVTPGIAKATATGGSIKVSTGRDKYGVGLPAGSYSINYYNGAAYSDHTHWQTDCMSGDAGVKLGSGSVGSTGALSGQPLTFSLPASVKNTAPQESGVCVSNSAATYGNQAPLTIM